ncbi:hypothetical protein M0813_06670 [Anaeramoeba flamelloides]|uniref:Mutator-like transposase domain-containing protein n=1 Tax=Anaeramoeba flamelloides TaxID=1746091 RepID=A0ABQ8XDF1_9EUKA|nr:hypothetical protein M0813_06670 [Anaeramoeba flamelloides]
MHSGPNIVELHLILQSMNRGYSGTILDELGLMGRNAYFRHCSYMEGVFHDVCLSYFFMMVDICGNSDIVIGFDGRWNARRHATQCTVGFLVLDGPKILIGKFILVLSCQRSKEKEKKENEFFSYVELPSCKMEGYLLQKGLKYLNENGVNIFSFCHDQDSCAAKIVRQEYGNEVEETLDINHFLISQKKRIDKWRTESPDLKILIRCFLFSKHFSKRMTNWIRFSLNESEGDSEVCLNLIKSFVFHAEANLRSVLTRNAKEFLLGKIIDFWEENSKKLIQQFRTNLNESFNAMIARRIPKIKYFRKYYYLRINVTWLWWNENRNIHNIISLYRNSNTERVKEQYQIKLNQFGLESKRFTTNKRNLGMWKYKTRKD